MNVANCMAVLPIIGNGVGNYIDVSVWTKVVDYLTIKQDKNNKTAQSVSFVLLLESPTVCESLWFNLCVPTFSFVMDSW